MYVSKVSYIFKLQRGGRAPDGLSALPKVISKADLKRNFPRDLSWLHVGSRPGFTIVSICSSRNQRLPRAGLRLNQGVTAGQHGETSRN